MRRFVLVRVSDISGISGTGNVAEGIEFSDGSCVIRWCTNVSSQGSYPSIVAVIAIHGHGGATTVRWLDD